MNPKKWRSNPVFIRKIMRNHRVAGVMYPIFNAGIGSAIMDWTGQPYQTPIRISMEDGCGCWAVESSNPIDSTYGIIGITVPSSSSRPWSRKIASRHVLRRGVLSRRKLQDMEPTDLSQEQLEKNTVVIPADPWATLILNTPNDHNRNGAPCELGTNLSGWVRSKRYEPFRASLCWVYVKPYSDLGYDHPGWLGPKSSTSYRNRKG